MENSKFKDSVNAPKNIHSPNGEPSVEESPNSSKNKELIDSMDFTSATLKIHVDKEDKEGKASAVSEILGLEPLNLAEIQIPSIQLAAEEEEWNRYTTLGMLREQNNRALFLIKDRNTRSLLVMKVLLLTPNLEKEQMQRFLEEAQIQAQLHHPAIIPVYEIGLDNNGQIYYTMPYISGLPLQEFIKADKTNNLFQHLLIFRQICHAVAYSHSRGVYHAELNPSNILIGDDGIPYLAGWSSCIYKNGGVKIFDYDANQGVLRNGGLQTIDGRIVGIANYIAPELVEQKGTFVEERSEVYALGAILYKIVTGKDPFEAENLALTVENICHHTLVFSKTRNGKAIPKTLTAILNKALAYKKAERYLNVTELLQDLEKALEKGPGFWKRW